jgi:hypothetical protein
MCQRAAQIYGMFRVTIPPINQGVLWTGEIKVMFKESEDKYIRIHGMEKRRWLKCEILHQRGQG